VTHVTDVKPLIEVVTYTDQENGNEVYQEVITAISDKALIDDLYHFKG
jgi:hypothetical protein